MNKHFLSDNFGNTAISHNLTTLHDRKYVVFAKGKCRAVPTGGGGGGCLRDAPLQVRQSDHNALKSVISAPPPPPPPRSKRNYISTEPNSNNYRYGTGATTFTLCFIWASLRCFQFSFKFSAKMKKVAHRDLIHLLSSPLSVSDRSVGDLKDISNIFCHVHIHCANKQFFD